MKIGPLELIVIFIVALLVIGPNKLPEYAKKLGTAMREFSKASKVITDEIREDIVEPLQEATQPIREVMEPIEELNSDIKGTAKDITDSLNSITKPTKKKTAPVEDSENESLTDTPSAAENTADAEPVAAGEITAETVAQDLPADVPAESTIPDTEIINDLSSEEENA